MTSQDDVVAAFNAIGHAWDNYRRILRDHLNESDERGRQAELGRRLGRTREMLRRDAMTDEQRAQLRETEMQRKRDARRPADA